jgi:valyl-tRNA synthetase
VDESVDGYQFNACAEALYNLVWRDFCDWYLEAIKPTVKSDPLQRAVLRAVLNGSMRLMHPVMPFVTEALWPSVQGIAGAPVSGLRLEPSDTLVRAGWPSVDVSLDDADAIARFSRVQALVLAIRNVRGERSVEVKRRITLHAPAATSAIVQDGAGVVETLAGLAGVVTLDSSARPADAVPVAFEGEEFWLSGLVDAVDSAAERQRLAKTIADRERIAAGYRAKLSNPGYLAKAKPELVEETRTLLAKAEADIAAARKASEALSGA